ncbi:MAG: riboflavin synthase, partial [Planctomycetota bacterium]|nr:riboflavin synthase [Planctomycetota bacterium]
LTVGEVFEEDGEERFRIYLIPHTLAVTGLGAKAVGDAVNLEADVLGRWVKHHLARLQGA